LSAALNSLPAHPLVSSVLLYVDSQTSSVLEKLTMHLKSRLIAVPLFLICCGFSQSVWGSPYDSHIKYVPESANLLVFVDAGGLYATPLAKAEDWKGKLSDEAAAGHALIPVKASRLLMAAEVDPLDEFRPVWDISLVDLNKAPDVLSFAKREQAPIEHLDGHRMIATQNGMLIVELRTQHYLTSSLASRQLLSRCLKGAAPNAPLRLSPYLANLSSKLPEKAQIVIGLDLDQVFSPQIVRQLLGKDASLRATDCLGSIKGLTCAVQVDDARHVEIRLEFAEKLEGLGADPYKSVQPVLQALGFSEDKLQIMRAVGRAESHAITLRGELPPDQLRNLFRKLETSGAHPDIPEESASESAAIDPMKQQMLATKKYFGSLSSILKELRELKTDSPAAASDKYARKIDGLAMLNVDPDLLTFSANVSGSLRYQSQAIREGGLRTGVRASIPTYTGYYAYGPYGSYASGYRQDLPNAFAINVQESAAGKQTKLTEWRAIENGLVEMKRKLTDKYKVEF
jgi:hypothetical protein